jgi:hypothetical protein
MMAQKIALFPTILRKMFQVVLSVEKLEECLKETPILMIMKNGVSTRKNYRAKVVSIQTSLSKVVLAEEPDASLARAARIAAAPARIAKADAQRVESKLGQNHSTNCQGVDKMTPHRTPRVSIIHFCICVC